MITKINFNSIKETMRKHVPNTLDAKNVIGNAIAPFTKEELEITRENHPDWFREGKES